MFHIGGMCLVVLLPFSEFRLRMYGMSDGFIRIDFGFGRDFGFVEHPSPNGGRHCDHARPIGHSGA